MVFMATRKRPLFDPRRQLAAFERLAARGSITDLKVRPNFAQTAYTWWFRLPELELDSEQLPHAIDFDGTQYQLRVTHSKRREPRVFIDTPTLPPKCIHTWHQQDGRLCLYKPSLWQWQADMQFDEELFTDTVMWIYHYEVWREKGKWYGKEAGHD